MSHIFLSYSHKDEEYVRKLTAAIRNKGIDVWRDDRISVGTEWPNTIEEFLDTCAAFILIMSAHSRVSTWVQNELARAQRLKKPILPLLLEGDGPWLAVESIQYRDVRDKQIPGEDFYEELTRYAPRSKHASFIYFSTQSELLYFINEKYFSGKHSVYCTTEFDSPAPTSSSPIRIYERLLRMAEMDDRGDVAYNSHKTAIHSLATQKLQQNSISQGAYREVTEIVSRALPRDLKPIVYLIQARLVRDRIKKVVPSEASDFSIEEYFIEDLSSHEFQIMHSLLSPRTH